MVLFTNTIGITKLPHNANLSRVGSSWGCLVLYYFDYIIFQSILIVNFVSFLFLFPHYVVVSFYVSVGWFEAWLVVSLCLMMALQNFSHSNFLLSIILFVVSTLEWLNYKALLDVFWGGAE